MAAQAPRKQLINTEEKPIKDLPPMVYESSEFYVYGNPVFVTGHGDRHESQFDLWKDIGYTTRPYSINIVPETADIWLACRKVDPYELEEGDKRLEPPYACSNVGFSVTGRYKVLNCMTGDRRLRQIRLERNIHKDGSATLTIWEESHEWWSNKITIRAGNPVAKVRRYATV